MSLGLDIHCVLVHYGASHVPTAHRWKSMKCVLHDDRSASASVNTETGKFRCFACDFSGDALDLIMRKEGVRDFASAVTEYERISGTSVSDLSSGFDEGKSRRRVPFEPGPVRGQRSILSSRVRRKPFSGP